MAISPAGQFDYVVPLTRRGEHDWGGRAMPPTETKYHPGIVGRQPDVVLSADTITLHRTEDALTFALDPHYRRWRQPRLRESFKVGPLLARVVEQSDVLHIHRGGTAEVGLVLSRQGTLIMALGAVRPGALGEPDTRERFAAGLGSEQEPAQGQTQTGEAAGTPAYMAPEQFEDFKHVDLRADVYSFGVMLFQMVTGRLPFFGRSWIEFERLHRRQPPPTTALANKEISDLVTKCLNKKPDDRWQDFSELRARLAAAYTSVTRRRPTIPVHGKQLDAAQWCSKAVSFAALGMHEDALASADRSVVMDDTSPSAWIAKGMALQNLRRAPQAIACFDRALTLNPVSAIAWANKGLSLKRRGELQEGLACQERALAIQPLNEKTWSNKGSVLYELGRNAEALEAFDRALIVNPNYATGWFNKGSALQESGHFGKAVDCYRRAVSLDPRLDYAWFRLGVSLEELRRPEEALQCYDLTLTLVPNDVQALSNKAGVLQDLNRHDEALRYLDRALEIDRTNGTLWHNKGSLLIDLKRFREAISALEEARKLGMADASRGIAFCLQRLGGDSPERLCARALQELQRGKALKALTLLDQALQVAPEYGEAWINKGVCLVHLHRVPQALECFNQSLSLNPDSAEAWINKGAALGELGKHREALECFLQAKRLGLPQAERAIAICRKNLGIS
jgi:tetratricopeptide (TPR) repeat protein